ncbi:nudix hydrolase homolog 9 isoform X2 [Wolffia australiana]
MNASGSAYNLLLSCPLGLSPSQVFVDFGPSYDRIQHPDDNLEKSISEIWCQRILENPSMYNGLKFRYSGFKLKDMEGSYSDNSVCLNLGLTDYRAFVGTNLNPLWEKFLVPSGDEAIRCQHVASPLGNGAIVETLDKKIILLQRSSKVGEFPGFLVFPGGHSEPKEVGISGHPTKGISECCNNLKEKVAAEMFDGIIREVVEEIGVPLRHLGEPQFIGISQRLLNVRPTAFFFLRCNLHSGEVEEFYSKAQDGFESTQLYAMSREEIEENRTRLPGCHSGGFTLYEQMVAFHGT